MEVVWSDISRMGTDMIKNVVKFVLAILVLAACGQAGPQSPQPLLPAADNNPAKGFGDSEINKVHQENVRLRRLLSEVKVIADKSVPFISEVRGKFLRAAENPDPIGTARLENISEELTEVSKKIDEELAIP